MPFVWRHQSGMEILPLRPGMIGGVVADASFGGSVLVGSCQTENDSFATRWIDGQALAIGGLNTTASAVSHDGSVIVGYGNGEAYRWTAETGMELLGVLPGARFRYSTATAMTPDGNTVIGYSDSPISHWCCVFEMFRWTRDTGIRALGIVGRPMGVAIGGSTIVGTLHSDHPAGFGFLWERGQFRRMQRVLAAYRVGPPINEFRVDGGMAVTPNGNVFAGEARGPDGKRQAFVASIGPYCLIDWDHSGAINSQDLFEYLVSFFAGDADYDGDSDTDLRDFDVFLNDWRFQDCR